MADEIPTTGPAGGSSIGPAQLAPRPEPVEEARIVEEVVIKPAPAKEVALPPQDLKAPPGAVPQTAARIPAPSPPTIHPSASPVPESVPASITPTLPAPTPEEQKKENEAITKILKDIKLPERHETPGVPQKPKEARVFDTTLGISGENKATIPDAPIQETMKNPEAAPLTPASDGAQGQTESASLGESLTSSIVAPLRTLKNDLQSIVREKKISLVRAVALESEKKYAETDTGEHTHVKEVRSRRVTHILFAVFLLVLLGVAASFGVYIITQERAGIPREGSDSSILFAESTYALPLENRSPLEVKRLIAQTRADRGATLGSITRFVPTRAKADPDGVTIEAPVTLEEFLRALGTRVSPDLLRALSSEFFFGIHTVDENAPLFVIPILSYERAFAGMLAWEQTMNADLSPAFTPVQEQILGVGGLPEKRRFEDVVMRNYDVRALKNDAGTIELYYSFPTQHLLVIGESVYSFTEVLSRLRAERKL